ncbi:hypothetical protein BT93_L3722 [Corymbia citriodora subsp. variegata]|uniref:Uncharacterized protein n=1 Tax=Corymbia citriodora subsp. variegata TaxID=360336 RepID=A0A8T0CVD3_CORYI|nr:hypothetical protein BT93_L3722 [Corymbia citriodora subsp. variegata]
MASHDKHLIARSLDEVWVISQGKVAPFNGNFQNYRKVFQFLLYQVNLVIAINREWLNYIEKAKKDKERITADVSDGLRVTPALVCHM